MADLGAEARGHAPPLSFLFLLLFRFPPFPLPLSSFPPSYSLYLTSP